MRLTFITLADVGITPYNAVKKLLHAVELGEQELLVGNRIVGNLFADI